MRNAINIQQRTTKMTVKTAYEQFVRIKRNQNLSEETIIFYDNVLKAFTEFYPSGNLCNEITKDTIEDYITYLRGKEPQLSSVSINSYLKGLRAILYFFMKQDYMDEFKVSLTKQEKAVKETYNEKELQALLKKPDINLYMRSGEQWKSRTALRTSQ